jgi:hypothetical protein
MKYLIASTAHSRPEPDLWASAVAPAAEARAWVGIGTRAVPGVLWRSLGWARAGGPRRFGWRPGYAALRSAGARGPAGWVAGRSARLGPDAVVTTNRARGTDGLCASGY